MKLGILAAFSLIALTLSAWFWITISIQQRIPSTTPEQQESMPNPEETPFVCVGLETETYPISCSEAISAVEVLAIGDITRISIGSPVAFPPDNAIAPRWLVEAA